MWSIETESTGVIQGHRTALICIDIVGRNAAGSQHGSEKLQHYIMAILNGYRLAKATTTPKQRELEYEQNLGGTMTEWWKSARQRVSGG